MKFCIGLKSVRLVALKSLYKSSWNFLHCITSNSTLNPGLWAHLTQCWPQLISDLLMFFWGHKAILDPHGKSVCINYIGGRLENLGFSGSPLRDPWENIFPSSDCSVYRKLFPLLLKVNWPATCSDAAAECWLNLWPACLQVDTIWPLTSLWPPGCFSRIFRV